MAPSRFDQGTFNTNYSSLHSHEAFVGEYQVMYTPGSTSPQANRAKKSTRFSRAASSKSQPSQSFMLPNNIPNTSMIMPDHGQLPNVNIHYTVPADEKQIVASLRTLQRDLNEAIQTINSLTRERDEAVLELKLLRAASKKQGTPASKTKPTSRVEEELFDISRSMTSEELPARRLSLKEKADTKEAPKTTISDDARVLSPINLNRPNPPVSEKRSGKTQEANAKSKVQSYQRPAVNETDNSIMEDPTAASNTSRRRRRTSLDENMTSAYILPDITVSQPVKPRKVDVSKEARRVLQRHGSDPEHVANCTVCQRLTAPIGRPKQLARNARAASAPVETKPDFTAQLTQIMKNTMLDEPTLRPKIHPLHALANVKKLLTDQFEHAKGKHAEAWEIYDAIEAPASSKKHAAASEQLFHWSQKMEECRINLDQLRDVEEGMREQESEP